EKFTGKDLDYLEELLHLAEANFIDDEVDNLMETHDKFHSMFIKTSGMERLIRILDNLHDYIVTFRYSFLSSDHLAQRSLKEHIVIFKSAKTCDNDEVYRLIQAHLTGITEYEIVVLQDK